jgi:hypothetical protein
VQIYGFYSIRTKIEIKKSPYRKVRGFFIIYNLTNG